MSGEQESELMSSEHSNSDDAFSEEHDEGAKTNAVVNADDKEASVRRLPTNLKFGHGKGKGRLARNPRTEANAARKGEASTKIGESERNDADIEGITSAMSALRFVPSSVKAAAAARAKESQKQKP